MVCDPADYAEVLRRLRLRLRLRLRRNRLSLNLGLNLDLNRRLALKAFRHTAAYDAAIATWLAGRVDAGAGLAPAHGQTQGLPLPETIALAAERVQLLRYGENPHQQAALYRWADAAPAFEQLQGKELSYNNLVDLEAAWTMPHEFAEPTVAIIKHTNPSGLAAAANLVDAYRLAFACDPVSAFGSIIAVTGK